MTTKDANVPTMTKIHCRNLISAAASFYKAAISVTSGLSSPLNNLAVIYKQQVGFFVHHA
jgi:hypothetical protein